MTEETAAVQAETAPAAGSGKKGKAAAKPKKTTKPKGDKKAPSHPPTAQMVVNAIKTLKERNGSSLQAIKKSIADTYKIDTTKQASFIRKAITKLVETGKLTQTKGTGASGSFKLATKEKAGAAEKTKTVKKTVKPKAAGSPKKKAAAKPKKAKASPKPKKVAAKKASPKKATKASPKKRTAPAPAVTEAAAPATPVKAAPKAAKKAAKPKAPAKVKLPKAKKAKSPAKAKAGKKAAPKKA